MTSRYTFASAAEQATAVASGEISATELLELVLQRLDVVDPDINAVVVRQLDGARKAAKQADAQLSVEAERPLHGVPITIKESWDWVGTASTSGNRSQLEHRPAENSVAVQRLIDAGAIIYGKTNLPLNMADWQTFNEIHGTTNNPWDLSRSPGGSSGGAAAALAVGLTPLELGSDIGGSIRNPAHYCGVFGHKPSFGKVPIEGHGFPGTTVSLDLCVGGPMARSVADLRLGLAVMSATLGDLGEVQNHRRHSDYRVAVLLESDSAAQTPELTEQLNRYVAQIAELGVKVDFKARPELDLSRAHHVFLTLLRATVGAQGSHKNYQRQREYLSNWDAGARDHRAYIAYGTTRTHWQWAQYKKEQAVIAASWAEFFQSYDLLLCPVAASAALPHDQDGPRADRTHDVSGSPESVIDQLFWAGLATLAYLPATVVPAGQVASGLPCGLQIIGPAGGDELCLSFAAELERLIGGFVAPPGYS